MFAIAPTQHFTKSEFWPLWMLTQIYFEPDTGTKTAQERLKLGVTDNNDYIEQEVLPLQARTQADFWANRILDPADGVVRVTYDNIRPPLMP